MSGCAPRLQAKALLLDAELRCNSLGEWDWRMLHKNMESAKFHQTPEEAFHDLVKYIQGDTDRGLASAMVRQPFHGKAKRNWNEI